MQMRKERNVVIFENYRMRKNHGKIFATDVVHGRKVHTYVYIRLYRKASRNTEITTRENFICRRYFPFDGKFV